jgi:hypothetical protein
MKSRTRVVQIFLTTDAAFLLWYGALSLLFTPGSVYEPYLSSGRILYGVLPAALGLGSAACAVWIGFAPAKESDQSILPDEWRRMNQQNGAGAPAKGVTRHPWEDAVKQPLKTKPFLLAAMSRLCSRAADLAFSVDLLPRFPENTSVQFSYLPVLRACLALNRPNRLRPSRCCKRLLR